MTLKYFLGMFSEICWNFVRQVLRAHIKYLLGKQGRCACVVKVSGQLAGAEQEARGGVLVGKEEASNLPALYALGEAIVSRVWRRQASLRSLKNAFCGAVQCDAGSVGYNLGVC